jgi:hypothetical protein
VRLRRRGSDRNADYAEYQRGAQSQPFPNQLARARLSASGEFEFLLSTPRERCRPPGSPLEPSNIDILLIKVSDFDFIGYQDRIRSRFQRCTHRNECLERSRALFQDFVCTSNLLLGTLADLKSDVRSSPGPCSGAFVPRPQIPG